MPTPGGHTKRALSPSRLLVGLAVALILAIPVGFRVSQAIVQGPNWDTYAFLVNAAEFAGRSVGYTEMHRPPMLSFITSIPFRFGLMSDATIQIVDGAIWWLGLLAFYALMRRRFSIGASLIGSIGLLALEPVWAWIGFGYSDLGSVALSIVAIWLFVKATEDNPNWYMAAIPMLIAAVLMRFGAMVLVFPIGVWMYFRARPIRHHRQILAGVGLAFLVYLPAGINFARVFDDFLHPLEAAGSVAAGAFEATADGAAAAATGPRVIYIQNLLTMIGPEEYRLLTAGVLGVALLGLVYAFIAYLGTMRPAAPRKLVLPSLLVGAAVYAQLNSGLAMRQGTIALAVIVAWRTLGSREDERTAPLVALDAVMLSWLLAYLDAHGHMTTQLPRYFVTMAPAAVYFLVRGWGAIVAAVRLSSRPQDRSASVVAHDRVVGTLAWSVLGVLAVGLLAQHVYGDPAPKRDTIVEGSQATARWLAAKDIPDDAVIYSDVWPATSWYLRREARAMPLFTDRRAFSHELEKSAADYFVTLRGDRFDTFEPVYAFNSCMVLERSVEPTSSNPQVLYLGNGWDAYLEELCDFDFDLIIDTDRYSMHGTALLDACTAEELSHYDAVALFGVKWDDFPAGEAAVRDYVMDGGTVVADASGNLDGLNHPLVDTVFLDTVVRRAPVTEDAELTVDEEFAASHRLRTTIPTSPFVDEGGGPWYGAVYDALAEGDDRRVIARLDGRPAIIEQRMGEGRILWVSNNLVWHAFLYEHPLEARLIQALFDEALSDGGSAGSMLSASRN